MKDIRIAFFDIDGTLIDMEKKEISPKMIETLKKLQEKNILLCIATGRGPSALPKFDFIDFDAYLTFNGSYCYNDQEVIFSNPIDNKDVQTIIKNTKAIHRPVALATNSSIRSNGKDIDLVDYFAIGKLIVYVADNFEEFSKQNIYQMMVGCYKEEYDAIIKDAPGTKITAWWNRAADIIPSTGGKGLGVEKILDYYGLSKEQAIAFGDGSNDIDMLKAVGTAVAMENATDDLKEVADVICGHVANDGIYHYCIENKLI